MGFLLFLSLLMLSVSLSSIHAWNFSDPSLARVAQDLYHSSYDLLKEVRDLVDRHPDKLQMEIMQASNKGYSAEVLVTTYRLAGGNTANKTEFRVLLSFGQHGRELITSEVALRLLSILSGEQTLTGWDLVALKNKPRDLVIKIVPMENLNGRKLVEAGDLCERRNGRGVDLNRNWGVDWGKKEKDFDPYEEFPGTAPFSEPEAQIMRKLSTSFRPHVWVTVHSGMEGLFMPYDHKNTTPDGLPSRVMKSLLEDLNRHHCQSRCVVGSGGGSVGYLAHGTTTDYMYQVVQVPLAFTFEIYGDPAASSKECFKMFNPLDSVSYNRILEDWSLAFLNIFQAGPHHLEMATTGKPSSQGNQVSMDSSELDLDLDLNRRRDGPRIEGLELGMQELRTYFRLFMLSSVLLMFMFCSRISKTKCITTRSSIPV